MSVDLQTVLQHVNATAETFVGAYYTAWDKDRPTLKELYRPNSRIVWNGNPISGVGEMAQLIDKMPASKHEVQAYDCHPLPGSTEANFHSIIVTVSGTVLFYNAAEGMPTQPAPRKPGQPRPRRNDDDRDDNDLDNLPRLFSHSFVLCPDRSPTGSLSYVVQSETLRFVA